MTEIELRRILRAYIAEYIKWEEKPARPNDIDWLFSFTAKYLDKFDEYLTAVGDPYYGNR